MGICATSEVPAISRPTILNSNLEETDVEEESKLKEGPSRQKKIEGGSNQWVQKVDLTESRHTNQTENKDGVGSTDQNLDVDDDLSEFGNQATNANISENTYDGSNKIAVDSTSQDDEDLLEDDEEDKAISLINLVDTTESENLQTEALSPASLFQYNNEPMTFF